MNSISQANLIWLRNFSSISSSIGNGIESTKRHVKQALNTQIIYYMFTIVIQIYIIRLNSLDFIGEKKFAISKSNLLPFLWNSSKVQVKCMSIIMYTYIYTTYFRRKKQSNKFHSSAFFFWYSQFEDPNLNIFQFLYFCFSKCVYVGEECIVAQFHFLKHFSFLFFLSF